MHQFLTLLFSFARKAAFSTNSSATNMMNANRDAANIVARKLAGEQAEQRRQEMEVNGLEWGTWPQEVAYLEVSGSHLISLRKADVQTYFHGPVTFDLDEGQLTLFDYGIYLGDKQSSLAPILQTVASLRVQDVNIPQFYLRPVVNRSSVRSDFLSCFNSVKSPIAQGNNFFLESIFVNQAARLFETRTAIAELLPLLQQKGLTVEWTGETLLVYRLEHTVGREALKHFADDVIEVSYLLKSVSEEAKEALRQKIVAMNLKQ